MTDIHLIPESVRRVDLNGQRLAYVEQVQGQPVVPVHCGVSDLRVRCEQTGSFAQGNRVIRYSRRLAYPNGPAAGTNGTVADNVEDLAGLIGRLGLAPTRLVGHFYSGLLLLVFTLRHPESVRTLILCEPSIPQRILNDRQTPGPRDMFALFLRSPAPANALVKSRMQSILPMERAFDRGDSMGAMKPAAPRFMRLALIAGIESFRKRGGR